DTFHKSRSMPCGKPLRSVGDCIHPRGPYDRSSPDSADSHRRCVMTTLIGKAEGGDVEPTPREAANGQVTECADIESIPPEADDSEANQQALEKENAQARQLRRNTRATSRALDGWGRVGSEEDLLRVCEEGQEEYESGQFLLERLGAE